jgi:hypothetical protein
MGDSWWGWHMRHMQRLYDACTARQRFHAAGILRQNRPACRVIAHLNPFLLHYFPLPFPLRSLAYICVFTTFRICNISSHMFTRHATSPHILEIHPAYAASRPLRWAWPLVAPPSAWSVLTCPDVTHGTPGNVRTGLSSGTSPNHPRIAVIRL